MRLGRAPHPTHPEPDMDQVIDYFMVPTSPYVYLGHDRFVALAARHGAQVRMKP